MAARRKDKTDPRMVREARGENQTEFWGRLGLTQAAGSRYECGNRPLKGPALILFECVYLGKALPEA